MKRGKSGWGIDWRQCAQRIALLWWGLWLGKCFEEGDDGKIRGRGGEKRKKEKRGGMEKESMGREEKVK
ncbi:MAG: hypothetical protein IJ479_04345 [Alphaproteobacteria bacterium]|nr:hypothetical protein [Alphaproteobacteria bacterium]